MRIIRNARKGAGAIILPALFLVLKITALHSDPVGQKIVIYERERKLSLLSLENKTGDETLDYLSQGILRMMRGKIDSITYLPVREPGELFLVHPSPDDDKNSKGETPPDRLLFRVDMPELNDAQSTLVEKEKWTALSLALGSSYLLYGSFDYAGGDHKTIVVDLHLFDAVHARTLDFRHTDSLEKLYENLGGMGESVKKSLLGDHLASLRVETEHPGAMLYLGDMYLGRSPFEGSVVPGQYTLHVEQEGFAPEDRSVEVLEGKSNFFRISDKAIANQSILDVKSDPPGAEVYLDLRYLGKTPLRAEKLEPGTHRLRLARNGYIDRIVGVVLTNGAVSREVLSMKKGDTLRYYTDPGYAVLDWTYHDLSFYTSLTSLAFYGGWRYGNIRADYVADSARRQVYNLGFWNIPGYSIYDFYVLDRNAADVRRYRRYANVSAGAGVFSIFLAGYFLYRGIEHDSREVGEVSLLFAPCFFCATPSGGKLQDGDGMGRSVGSPAQSSYLLGLTFHF